MFFFPPGYGLDASGPAPNSAPVITVPGAQSVSWNVTGATPKNVLNLDNTVSFADANNDALEATLAVSQGTLTLGRETKTDDGSNITHVIRVPQTVTLWSITIGVNVAEFNAATDDTAALRAELIASLFGYLPAGPDDVGGGG